MEPNKIKESIQAVIEGLEPLAQKLQKPVEELWRMFIIENYVKAVWWILAWIGLIIAVHFFNKYLNKKYKDIQKKVKKNPSRSYLYEDAEQFIQVGKIFVFIAWICVFFSFFIGGEQIISRFINPDLNVLRDIFQMLNK